jgi:hypothetical protein
VTGSTIKEEEEEEEVEVGKTECGMDCDNVNISL